MSRRVKNILITVVVVFVLYMIIKNISDARQLNEGGVYVIGKIDKILPASGGLRIYVSYMFKGELIKSDYINANSQNNKPSVGYYFLKIDPTNPKHFNIIYDRVVHDSLIVSPYNGWDSLPKYQ